MLITAAIFAILAILISVLIYISFSDEKPDTVQSDILPSGTAKPEKNADEIEIDEEEKAVSGTEETGFEQKAENTPEDTRPPVIVELPEPGSEPYTDFQRYCDMSEEEQEAFYDSFESSEAFFNWYNQAKSEYAETHPEIIIDGSTNIELKP